MAKRKIDTENIEENIKGCFLSFLAAGGVDTKTFDGLVRIKHNTFEAALYHVYKTLFMPDKLEPHKSKTLIDADDLETLEKIAMVYIELCDMCDKCNGIYGFIKFTGLDVHAVERWSREEQGSRRRLIANCIQSNFQQSATNKAFDFPIGVIANLNHSQRLGLFYDDKKTQATQTINNFILPGENIRAQLEKRMREALPKTEKEEGEKEEAKETK